MLKQLIVVLFFSKPDTLREMAWLKLIKKFKEGKVDDPYAKARKFLPLNSDIQPFVFI